MVRGVSQAVGVSPYKAQMRYNSTICFLPQTQQKIEVIGKATPYLFINYSGFDGVDDITHVGIGYPGTGGEADSDFEERFRDSVGVG